MRGFGRAGGGLRLDSTRWQPMWAEPRTRAHASSQTSRVRVCSRVSPGSMVPPGSVQSVAFQVTRTIWDSGVNADAKRLGRLGRRRQEGWVEPPDAVAGPIRDDGLLDKGLEGRGGSGVWGRVAGRGGHGRRRRLVSGSTPRSMRSTPSLNWWFM